MSRKATKRPSAPTDEEWRAAVQRFRFFRFLEDRDARERAEALPAFLAKEANTIYRRADELERADEVELANYGADAIVSSLKVRGYSIEIEENFYSMHFLSQIPRQLDGTPAVLRSVAGILHEAAEHARRVVQVYFDCVAMIRERSEKKRPRDHPSVSGWWLTRWADERGLKTRKIAEKLVDHKIEPDTVISDGEDASDPPSRAQRIAQWEEILRKTRPRARKRGSGTD